MRNRPRPRLTYANVIATLALFLALGGATAYAASLGKNSVGNKQLKKNAVTGAKVKDGSLLAGDFKAGQLPSGERGPVGERGPQGVAGAPGATSVVTRYGYEGKPKEDETGQSFASCLPGETVTGGGFEIFGEPEEVEYELLSSGPTAGEANVESDVVYTPPEDGSPATGWRVLIDNGEPSDTVFFRAYVMCARP
ncbi:MAG TPA: hypothetical protein VGO13_11035 [Solirubrobacterales bacterium]|jgi:hypothetical protein|nr:hypothetical protein [Solirubrobacterales bacterium]